mgnify:CR=1 FL=1
MIEPLKIIARHLTIDMYNCKTKKLSDTELLQKTLHERLNDSDFNILKFDIQAMDDGHFAILVLLKEGHMTIHAYSELKYVAADVFLCDQNAEPELFFKALRSFFKPDKTKTTYLKRGDFGTVKDMKPKIKTKVAPLRRIHNTGARVIRLLAHRKNQRPN